MKNLSIAFIFVLIFSNFSLGYIRPVPLEKAVKKSDLIIVGTLQSVSEYNTEEFRHSSGVLLIQDIIWGIVKTEKGSLLKNNDQLRVKWTNSNLYACQFNFPKNKKGIWLLQINDDGSIKSLYLGMMVSLKNLSKVEKILRWDKTIENIKTVKTTNFTEKSTKPFTTSQNVRLKTTEIKVITKANTDSTQDALLRGLLVFIIALILYRLLYRARFKIKVKREKKEKD